jgi:hypothetical protein
VHHDRITNIHAPSLRNLPRGIVVPCPPDPKGQKRPAAVIGNAVRVMRIATGEEPETDPTAGKNPTAVALGKLGGAEGGKARASSLSSAERREIASRAAAARWKKPK